MVPTKAQLLWMYGTMAKARYYEDTMAAAYMEGKTPKFDIGAGPVPGEMHLAAGQEPCAAGVCVHAARDAALCQQEDILHWLTLTRDDLFAPILASRGDQVG